MLQNGADVTLTNRNGDSALHRACWSGDLEILQKLVEYGALIDGPNYNGLTPCTERGAGNDAVMVAALAGYPKIVEYFLKQRANVNQQE